MSLRTKVVPWLGVLCAWGVSLAPSEAAARPASCPLRASWPTTAWPEVKQQVKTQHAAEVAALEALVFPAVSAEDEKARKGVRSDALLVIKGGVVVYERYERGYDETKRHQAWSISKSITSLLAGVATQKAAFDIDKPICDALTPTDSDHCRIKTRHLLDWTSGLQFKEFYEDVSNQKSSVLALLYGVGRFDMLGFMMGHVITADPGTAWSYSTGDATYAMGVVDAYMKSKGFSDQWQWEELFDKIGAGDATFEADAQGLAGGGSYFTSTARDLARVGFLTLNDGCWDLGGAVPERLLPEGWMTSSLQVTEAWKNNTVETRDLTDSPGLSWWTNVKVEGVHTEKPFKDLPDDTYMGLGHWGQRLVVVPSKDVIVVRFGDDREVGVLSVNDMVKAALALTDAIGLD